MKFKPPGECPVCGKDVYRGAKACPECGADELSGWDEKVDLEDEFRYDEFLEEEFGDEKKRFALHPAWWITALVLIVISLITFFYTWSLRY